MLLKSRAFTAVSVLCLSLAIGANSTIFSLVDGFWTRPLPVTDPGGIVYLSTATPRSVHLDELSYAEFLDYQNQAKSFSGLAATERRGPILTGDGFAESTMSNVVSENYFTVLGVGAQLGRVFTPADANSGDRVVVMSHNLWQRRFGGNPKIIGRTVRLNGSYTVVGVAPKEFRGTELWQDSDFWIPMSSWDPSGDERSSREYRSYSVMGRLRPGVSIEAARAEIAAIAARLEKAYPKSNKGCRGVLETAREHLFQSTKYIPFILLGIVVVVLLIACGNLANLLLARAASRAREIGVRLAMGASRGRLIMQLMTESVLIGVLGTIAGLLVAAWLISVLPAFIVPPANNYLHMDFRMDHRVLTFTLAVSLATVFVFGLAPAFRASRTDVISVLKDGASKSARRVSPQNVLVIVQVALSTVLLISAGLLVRTFVYSMNLDLGFQRRNVLVADIHPPYGTTRSRAFYQDLLERVKGIPGIQAATLALRPPLSGSGGGLAQEVIIPGRPVGLGEPLMRIKYTAVDLNYFRTLGVTLLHGRDFDTHDGPETTRVVIINETMSRRFWPDEDPIGKRIQLPGASPASEHTIIGVVRDTRINSIEEPEHPYFYLPYRQTRFSSMYLIATSRIDPLRAAKQLRTEVATIDSGVPVLEVTTMSLLVRSSLYMQQVSATVVGGLGMIGLFLAAVGLYGLISYSVTQRTREIGIRMALGAQRRNAVAMVLRQAGVFVSIGATIGIAAAAFATPILSGLVYGISLRDPMTFAAVILVMLVVAALASYVPARRATRVDPINALRYE